MLAESARRVVTRGNVLLMAVLLVATSSIATATPVTAKPPAGGVLFEQRAALTKSIAGFPTTTDPGRQLASANLRIAHDGGRTFLKLDAVLRGIPNIDEPNTYLEVNLGRFQGNSCQITTSTGETIYRTTGKREQDVVAWTSPPPANAPWNCTAIMVSQGAYGQGAYDVMVGPLADTYATPRLSVGRPKLIGKNQKTLRLVRGVKQSFDLVVTNHGKAEARGVVITAKGKGISAKKRTVGTLEPGESLTVRVTIRLKSKTLRRTKVKFRVAGVGSVATRTVTVKRVKAPKLPANGLYKDGQLRFRVKNGKITRFYSANMRMRCAPPLSYPQYKNVSLGFPTTKIPRHGYVSAADRYRKGNVWYNAFLDVRVTGNRVAGTYHYTTSGSCSVVHTFKAKRVGK